ncbi:hypothetical protein GCM10010503_09920 [Streptomyces lucensis JCM 4490]|uniref:Gram-positive cocci surface proteins LPxTG domain-containing protein n=1 Tax=Streptomyces lucensis JCM 4490 TaxID=1306176 RepID=A0A918MMB7_9ACTN|nr:hypothetical protein GCM10010503_09920 [Streptomyces lucensis JCM 4490]
MSSAAAHADATPSCAAVGDRAFPLTTRIHGGPTAYEPGGGYGTWYIDLTNTTRQTCAGIHPVVVLVDDKRTLRPSQPQLDFYDGSHAEPVTFESTDEQELVGVMEAEDFDGFTVAPGKTVTVKVRLSLTSDAVPDRVTANAAVVQRRGDDGDWVGQSNDYRFAIAEDAADGEYEQGTEEPRSTGTGTPRSTEEPRGTETAGPSGAPSPAPTPAPTSVGDTGPDASLPSADEAEDADEDREADEAGEAGAAGERARELARTGPGLAHALLAAAALVAVGGGAHLLIRRRR